MGKWNTVETEHITRRLTIRTRRNRVACRGTDRRGGRFGARAWCAIIHARAGLASVPTPGASPVTSSDGSSYPRRFIARRIRRCQAERRITRCQAHRRAAVRSTQAAGSRQEAVRRRNPDDTSVGAHATRVPAPARAIRAGASHPRRRVREQTSASPTLHRRRPGEAAIVASNYPILGNWNPCLIWDVIAAKAGHTKRRFRLPEHLQKHARTGCVDQRGAGSFAKAYVPSGSFFGTGSGFTSLSR